MIGRDGELPVGVFRLEILARIPGTEPTHKVGVLDVPVYFDKFGGQLVVDVQGVVQELREAVAE